WGGWIKPDATWPEGDFRNTYFRADNLRATLARVEALQSLVPAGSALADMALRFILANPVVSTTIPGMRRAHHVEGNTLASDGKPLPAALYNALRAHRWDRSAVLP